MARFANRWADISLRAKITGVTVFILFLGLIVAGVGTLSVLHPILSTSQANTLKQLRKDPSPALARGANPAALERGDVLYANQQYYVALLDTDGELQYDNTLGLRDTTLPDIPPLDIDHGVRNASQTAANSTFGFFGSIERSTAPLFSLR